MIYKVLSARELKQEDGIWLATCLISGWHSNVKLILSFRCFEQWDRFEFKLPTGVRVLGFYFPNLNLSVSIKTSDETTWTLKHNFCKVLLCLYRVSKGPVVLVPIHNVAIFVENNKHWSLGNLRYSQSLINNLLNYILALKGQFIRYKPLVWFVIKCPNLS
jgi:hypothetical protein